MENLSLIAVILMVCCFLILTLLIFAVFCYCMYAGVSPRFKHKSEIDLENKKTKSDLEFDTK